MIQSLHTAVEAALIGTIVVTLIYFYLYNFHRQNFLFYWSISWLLYTANITVSWIDLYIPDSAFLEYIQLLLQIFIAYFFLLGTWKFLSKPWTPLLLLPFALGFCIGFLLKATGQAFMIYALPSAVLMGLSYIYAGFAIWQHKEIKGWGRVACSITTIALGLHILDYPFMRPDLSLAVSGFTISFILRIAASLSILLLFFEWTRNTLTQSENTYRQVLQGAQEGIWILKSDATTYFTNPKLTELLGYTASELKAMELLDLIHWEDRIRLKNVWEQVTSSTRQWEGLRFHTKEGSIVWIFLSISPLQDEKKAHSGYLAMLTNISSNMKMEKELREKERQFTTLIANLPGIVYRCRVDEHWTMEFISSGCLEITGYPPEDFLFNKVRSYASIIHPEDEIRIQDEVFDAVAKREPFKLLYRILNRDGKIRWVYEQGVGITQKDGSVVQLEGFISDYTEKKEAEEIVENSLHEKEILLREVHHRLKNYIQIVSSLLSMHLGQEANNGTEKILQETRNRIHSMSLVHESLFPSDTASEIPLPEYLEKLAHNLLRSYGYGPKDLQLEIACEPVFLNLRQAIPMGLIANELITNSLKHAFPVKTEQNLLSIRVRKLRNSVILEILDNGKGFSVSSEESQDQDSMGVELLQMLVNQLKGSMDVEIRNGTHVRIRFPIQS